VPPVECLPSQLNQVFMNLLVNAAHAIPTRGDHDPHVERRRMRVDRDQRHRNRHGADVARRIFDPFFTTKPVGQGTGSGCRCRTGSSSAIAARSTTSVPGQGTTFCVRLPIRRPHADASDATAIAQRAWAAGAPPRQRPRRLRKKFQNIAVASGPVAEWNASRGSPPLHEVGEAVHDADAHDHPSRRR
jgi:hypothetical protein